MRLVACCLTSALCGKTRVESVTPSWSAAMPDTHLKLMIPGPIEVEDDVLDVLGAPVQVHYGDAWVAIHNETLDLLRQVFKTSGKMFILPGSAHLGNHAPLQPLS